MAGVCGNSLPVQEYACVVNRGWHVQAQCLSEHRDRVVEFRKGEEGCQRLLSFTIVVFVKRD